MKAKDFVPNPQWSIPYPPLPHRFHNLVGVNILCRAPKGVIKPLVPKPLRPDGDGDLFVLAWGHCAECEGYDVHEIQINTPIKWKGNAGHHTLVEYIDSDMGLIAGREIWGYPKKMGHIVWTKTAKGWRLECSREGVLLMRAVFSGSKAAPDIKWPSMNNYLLKRVPPASRSGSPVIQLVRVPDPEPVIHSATNGSARVEFFDGPHDHLTQFGPVEVLGATTFVGDLVLDYGELLETIK